MSRTIRGRVTETVLVHGVPKTKGIRNQYVGDANAPRGGPMGDRRDKRSQDAKRSWEREDWE